MREPAPGRPSARMGLAAGRGRRSQASLAVLSLSLGATVSLSGVIEAAGLEREGQARPRPRWAHSAAVVDGRIYVIGGAGADNQVAGSVEAFDPAKGTWSACADMPTARALLGVGVIGGRIYTVGGTTMGLDEVYDPARGRWTTEAALATARGWFSASIVDGRIYVFGGRAPAPDGGILESSGALPGLEVYTPAH